MLKRITCEKFKTQPEDFRPGLNVILGSSDGSNAIGKSTFLLILDFVFGGDNYPKSAKDVITHLDHHTINFIFEFDGFSYFFSRSTSRPSVVNRCDSQFHVIEEMSVPNYRKWLFHEYRILLRGITFDEIVERFFRIYGHGSHNEHKPLQSERESMATAVEYLMKLLDKFEAIQNLKTAEESYGIKPSKQAERSISDITADIGENKDKIESLEKRRERLCRQNEEANLRALGIDPQQAERLAEIKSELGKLSRRKSRLISQLNAVRNNMPGNDGVLKKDFSALLRFFPDAKIDAFTDAELNNVGLFLPFFDEKTVKMVEQALRDSEAIVPAETGSHKELITLKRDPAFADVFSDMNLITYRIDSARKQPALRRLIALARALTQDMIAPEARKSTLKKVLDEFESEIAALKKSGKFEEISKAVTGLALRTLTIDYGSSAEGTTDNISEIVELSEFDINNLFERAGKVLGEGLHKEYWVRHAVRDFKDVKTEIIVLTNDNAAMERLESFADKLFNELYDMHKTAFRKLKEDRRDAYKKLALSSTTPIALDWELPPTIDFLIGEDAVILEKHLYIPSDGGEFKVSLNDWELGVIREEMKDEKGAVAWLRNLDRKRWSLEIPYEVDGVVTSMFPDLIVVRADAHGYVFDVLEPHDSSRKDNYPKAVGLAKFAEKHGEHFGRIQLIRKVKGADKRDHFYRLDMGKLSVRNRVRGVTSNAELDRIFNEDAQTEE